MQTAVLAAVLCSRTAFPANISQSDLYNYVRTTWNVTSLSDDAIQALLDQAPSDTIYGGIPYKNLIGVMIEAPRMYDALSQGDYRAAGQVALEYGQDALFDGAMEWLGLASISAPVEAAAWPINAGLTAFADAVKKNAFRTHCLLYFAARNAGNTYDAIVSVNARGGLLDADPSIVQQGLLTETDDGWLYTSQGAYGPTSVPGYTSAQFYEFAETLYQCQRARSTFANDRSNLRQAFLSDAYPQAPTIYQQPRGGSYAQGGSLLLTVGASGQQPLHYQWFRNGASISGATTSSYRVQSPDDGDYQVQVTDASSLTTSSETVTVDLLPTGASVVISAPANNSTLAGTAVVRVTAPAATRVEFYLDGVLQVTDNSGPFSWSWNTATADNGQSTLSARAYNGSTLLATSAGVHVTVDNPDSGSCLDTNEPNNSSLSAALLPLGTANAGFICTPSDVDWFRILVDRPGMLTVTLSVPAGKDFELELYGPNALWVDGSYNPPGENERIDFPAQQAGTYWARTYGYPIGSGSFSADQPYEIVAGLGDPVASGTNSGIIGQNVIWSGVVDLSGDVTIIGGGSLTILPGTLVRCASGDDRSSGNDSSRVEIILNGGTLNASGTMDAPIRFTSRAQNPLPGNWYGIRILDGDVTVRNCVVEYAVEGIRFEDGDTRFNSYTLSDVTVQRCTGNGVFTTGGSYVVPVVLNNFQLLTNGTGLNANGPVEFRGGRAEGNAGNGISANNAALVVTGVLVKLNGSSGIDAGYSTTVTLTDCTLSFNRGHGIEARWATLQMQNCTVTRNDSWGIYWNYWDSRERQVEIWNSMIQSNASGVFLSGNLMVGVVSNTITDNGGTGLQLSLYGGGVSTSGITGNVIRRQDVGVRVAGSGPSLLTLSANDFYQNTSFELRNDSGFVVIANGNYWGEPTTTELAQSKANLSRIYDIRDGASQQVLINQWYAAPLSGGSPGSLHNFDYSVPGTTAVVSGEVSDSQTWSGKVVVIGDVTIIGGGSLTIQAGTEVLFDALHDTQASGNDLSRCELIVQGGTLLVDGTAGSPVKLSSGGLNKAPGDWYGVRILDGDVTVRSCVVEYAVEGIRFEDTDTRFSSYTLSDVTVQRCTGNGVFTTGGTYVVPVVLNNFQLLTNGTGLNANGPVEFRGGRAEGNNANGIVANNTALAVTGTLVKLNGSSGIDAGYGTTVTLTDCILSFNRGNGIQARWASLQMQGCTVMRNDNWGIYWMYYDSRGRQVEIWNSMIQSNASGVFLSGNLMVGVVSNTITDNGATGLHLSLYGGGVSTSGITGNVIRRQDVGVRVAGSGPSLLTLSANDFYQNTSFELRNESAFAVIANGNYWGDPTTTELAQSKANLSRIYDIRDGASQQVLINQWYAAPLSGGSPGSPHNFDYTVPGTTAVVSGEVSDSQTWSGKVVVIGDVTIIGGGSLTIQPGTEVLFDALHDTQASGNDLSRCELIVQGGTLLVDGTAGSPVKLSSGGLNKAPGDWYGVRILDGDVTVRSCVVEYAVEGIRFEDTDTRFSSYTLSDVTVQRCTGNGVFTTGGTYVVPVVLNNFQLLTNGTGLNANGPVEFRGGRAEGNNANGIVANNTALAVTGTLVKLNGSSGIDAGYGTTVTLTDCILSFNRGNGIQARWASLQMQGCTVMRNDNWGIYWMYYDSRGRQVEIWNSMIQSNASGVFLSGNLMVGVVSNTITDNGATGLQLSLYGGGVSTSGVTGNVIRRQDVGVSVSGSAPSLLTLSGNDFYQNTSFELRNDTGISITANDCYWGEPTTTEWAAGQVNLSRIYDLQDNASYGQVLIQSIRGTAALQPPRFTTQPQGVTALPGDTVTLSADASGSVPISFQWYRNGATVAEATDPDLTLPSLDASKAGNYFVVAANAVGRATSFVAQVTLIVPPAPPVIVQHPVSQTVALGGSVSFAVAATGTGPFTYQWRKNGAPIPGATAATLSIPFVAVSDAAEYTVTVTNPGGNATSQPATLTLNTSGGTAVTRQITRAGTNFFVTVTVIPPVGTPAYLVEEFIPTNFSVFNISGSGSLDAPNGRVVWGPFWDGLTRALTYTLIPPPGFTGTATLNGAALFFGATAATSGDNTIRMTPTNPTTLAISEFYGYFMITINGTVGSTYRLEVAGDPSGPWEPLELVTLPRSPWPYVDWDSAGQTNRFYRSVLVE